jgi:hypothetical protein
MVDAKDQDWWKGSYYETLAGTKYLYAHGLPFRQLHADNIDDLMLRIKRKKASLLVYDGGVGEGKTTMAVHTADYVNIKWGRGGPIDFRGPQLALGGKEFGEKILVCHDQKLLVIIYDEAGDLDKKTTMSAFNRRLMRIFEMYRGFAILVVVALPRFYKLENELLDLGVWRLTLHCEDRTDNQGNFRVFDIEQTYYIKEAAKKIIVKPRCYDSGAHNYQGHFLDLPKERSDELDRVSVESKRKETKRTVYDVKDRFTVPMIAKHFGMSPRWVLLRLKELDDVGDVKVFERKKWYQKDIIKQIESLEEEKR